MQKKIMIIGAGEMQTPVIQKAINLGLYVITVDGNIKAPGNKYANLALEIDTNDIIKILEASQNHQIDGILTTSDYPVRVVAYVCQQMGLKGLSLEAAVRSTNKFELRKCLNEKGIISPLFQKLSRIDDLEKINSDFKYPLIIKPVDSSASRGVRKVDSLSELKIGYTEAAKYSQSGEVILEEYLEGPEYSVESLSQNGKVTIIAITEKKTNGDLEKYFVEDRHTIPANISNSHQEDIIKMVSVAVEAIGLDNCAAHTELKLTEKGPIIIEIGARLGGDFITSDIVPLATGVDMLKNVISISLGININIEKTKNVFAGIQFINSENYQSAKQHLENIKTKNGFVRYELKDFKNIALKNSMDRLGYFICENDTRDGLSKLLNIN